MKIAAAGNTEVPAYLVLIDKGYAVSRRIDPLGEAWIAVKDGAEFQAESPLMLLGLITMTEVRGKDWVANDKEIEAFLTRFDLK